MGHQCENLVALCPVEHGDSGVPFLLQQTTDLMSSIRNANRRPLKYKTTKMLGLL
jgi:hypothetical protein